MDKMIIYEDNTLIVVHKPAGIATESARIGQADVVSELRNYRKRKNEDTYIGVVHRLDQPVEGLLVFAKTQQTAAKLTQQLNEGALKKTYMAIVSADVNEGKEEILTDYLLKDSRTNLSKVVEKDIKGAKQAKLRYKCIENYGDFSVFEVELFTGRHHQIRVQLSHAGMALLGDSKYGNEASKELSKRLGISNTALLADKLTFCHPIKNKNMEFALNYSEIWQFFKYSDKKNTLY